ncbi:hypothetical protein FA95DRAFT_1503582, partial [Auriscalpium vulgare]
MRVLELRALEAQGERVLKEAVEPRRLEANSLNIERGENMTSVVATAGDGSTLATSVSAEGQIPLTVAHNSEVMEKIKASYSNDSTFGKVIDNIDAYPTFSMEDGLVTTLNRAGDRVLCIPRGVYGKRSIVEFLIDQGHQVLGHMGTQKTTDYLR